MVAAGPAWCWPGPAEMGTTPSAATGSDAATTVILWGLGAGGVAAATVWGGAQLAALATRRRPLPAGLAEAFAALVRLPAHAGHPAAAWAPELGPLIAGPVAYWAATAVAAVAVAAIGAVAYRVFARPGVGTDPRRRLGVDTRARLATARDIAPLVVAGPEPGRLIVGRVAGKLVATENRARAGQAGRRRRARQGDRSGVAVIGPTRCGKTANVISAILEHEGPAVLSSVKDDLVEATIARRCQVGEVRVFDPTGVSREPSAQWSPLRAAGTLTGAQKAARALATTVGVDERGDVNFFTDVALDLLWPLLYAAHVGGRTMSDVLLWILRRDRPTRTSRGEVAGILDAQLGSDDVGARLNAAQALATLESVLSCDHRTQSSIFITAQRLLRVWQDPAVAAATQSCEIDLDWLLEANNTLYVCSPLDGEFRLAPLFAGLLSDLVQQQAYDRVAATRALLPDLLVVLDEAANTPTRWLPQVASTCSGLGMLLVTIWQSKAQIDAAYGVVADSVLTNHGTKVIFSGVSDAATLDYATRLLGDEEVLQRGSSTDLVGGGRSMSESTTRVHLLPGDVLRQAAVFEGLLIHGTLPAAHLHARPYHLDRRLRAMSGSGPIPQPRGSRRAPGRPPRQSSDRRTAGR